MGAIVARHIAATEQIYFSLLGNDSLKNFVLNGLEKDNIKSFSN